MNAGFCEKPQFLFSGTADIDKTGKKQYTIGKKRTF